jgi:hypothetical protein
MPSRSDLEIKSRLILGIGLLSLVVVLLLRLLLPLLIFLCVGGAGYWLWLQYRKRQQQQQRRQTRINAQFYQLLHQQRGRVSVLDLAMRTQMEGSEAQNYLNTQAHAFSAFFDTTPQGDIIYIFNLAAVQGSAHQTSADHAKAAWDYAEQARMEQAHAAWLAARQIKTIRQISKHEAGARPDIRSVVRPDIRKSAIPALNPTLGQAESQPKTAQFKMTQARTAQSKAAQARTAQPKKAQSLLVKATAKRTIKLPKESGYPEVKRPAFKQAVLSSHGSNNDLANGPTADQARSLPVVRGRAARDRHVVTIDVQAVQG